MAKERHVSFEGQAVTVNFDRKLCIHAAECGRSTGELFKSKRDPWCAPDEVEAAAVAEVIERCPTGALTYTRNDGGAAEATPTSNTAHIAPNGPVYLRGDLRFITDGGEVKMTRAALCRCGASKNKPFCDNSHYAVKFNDAGPVGETGNPIDAPGGPLVITAFANGPVQLEGNLTVSSGSGRAAYTNTKTFLCRCGESKNRPFCDGTHNSIGFEAP